MFRVQMLLSDASACSYYRVMLPYTHLREELLPFDIELDLREINQIDPMSGHDAYIFMRIPDPKEFTHAISYLSQKSHVIWDLDDDIVAIPDNSPVRRAFPSTMIRWLNDFLAASHIITVSTPQLKDSIIKNFERKAEDIVVLPNLIDTEPWGHFHPGEIRQFSTDAPPIRVMVSGSGSHVVDLPEIMPTLDMCINRSDTTVYFYGIMPSEFQNAYPQRVVDVPWSNMKHYPGILTTLAPHIALLPLIEHEFNESKSNIKYLEMTLAGAVCVASNVGPYRDTINSTVDGALVTSPDMFSSTVENLIQSPEIRKEWFRHAAEKVSTLYTWNNPGPNRDLWIDFFKSLPDRLA